MNLNNFYQYLLIFIDNMENQDLLSSNEIPDAKFDKVMPKEGRTALTSAQLLPREENKDWFQVPNSKFKFNKEFN
jgi:hypothetical protein